MHVFGWMSNFYPLLFSMYQEGLVFNTAELVLLAACQRPFPSASQSLEKPSLLVAAVLDHRSGSDLGLY